MALHDAGKKGSILEIAERLDIAIDVAHAVTYLHTYTGTSLFSFKVCADLIQSYNISSIMTDQFWMDVAFSLYLVSVNGFIISNVSSLLV
jgi:hypothetical protein